MNRVLLSLSTIMLIALSLLPFINFSANRFLGGQAKKLTSMSDASIILFSSILVLIAIAVFWRHLKTKYSCGLALLVSAIFLCALFILLGKASEDLMLTATPAARSTIGSAFWVCFLLINLILLDIWQRLPKSHGTFIVFMLCLGAALAAIFLSQNFESLSLIKEYRNQESRFSIALWQHLKLVLIAFTLTLPIGLSLGILAWRYGRIYSALFSILNFLQTIPSIALFALLMIPLSWMAIRFPELNDMGLSGIGTAPSVIALVLYTLLPLARNTHTGIASVPADTREAAKAMGMTKAQIFYQVILPLSLPMILSGIRVVLVQLIGLTVLAALIGAGGLGIFVWEGLGQYALDMVLLGALPTIILAVLFDLLLQGLIWYTNPIKNSHFER